MKKTYVLAAGLAFATACNSPQEIEPPKPPVCVGLPQSLSTGQPQLRIRMHNHAKADDGVKAISLDILRVIAIKSSGEEIIISSSKTVTIPGITPTTGSINFLSGIAPPEGEYDEIRIITGDSNKVLLDDDSTEELKIPSGSQTGLKLKLNNIFLRDGRVSDIIADYDLAKSLKNTGQGWILSPPVVKVESISSFTVAQDQLLQSKLSGPELENLLENSIMVFEGNTIGIAATQIEYSSHFGAMMPYTYFRQQITDALKGSPGTQYDVRTIGGIASGMIADVSHAAHFQVGEHAIVFLQQYSDGNIMVTSGYKGVVELQ